MKYIIVMLAALALCGCGQSQRQVISNARAGAQAYLKATDPGVKAKIAEGLAKNVIAATADIPNLPEPKMTPDEVIADPDEYCDYALEAYEGPPKFDLVAPKPTPSPWTFFEMLGNETMEWGSIIAIVGLVVMLLGWCVGKFGWGGLLFKLIASPLIAPIARVAAALGGLASAVGAAILWLMTYWWVAALLLLAGLGWFAIVHHKDVARCIEWIKSMWHKIKAFWHR